MNQFVRGTCEDMCPKSEIDLRIRERLVHFFETEAPGIPDRHRMVKEFSRSAADRRQPKPWEIRTPRALMESLHYLLTIVLTDSRRPFHQRYEFIFDRMRAIRQEVVIQDLPAAETLPLLKPIVRFLCLSAYRLCESPISEFDPKICSQHLQECLKKVLRCQEELSKLEKSFTWERFEMERLYLAFNLGSAEATSWAINRHGTVKPELMPHIAAQLDCLRGNFFGAIQRMFRFTPLEAAVASLQLPTFRRRILQQFSIAYQSRVQTVPLEWLETVLHYDMHERTFLPDDCRHYNIQIVPSDKENRAWAVKFERTQFDAQQAVIPPRKSRFIDDALERSGSISDVLLCDFYG
ncbi:germinal-center associated nuclear protein isoform X2 [Anopheles coustani]|uniref:germinal-center associated nuclear protein isoform X2 n=1 Tax=Anopheles coustani TaxID=139045 RepID=UPI00265ABD7B|nr:germinal-center associated nuclear protein isoform X2 [Anopheles coustani]